MNAMAVDLSTTESFQNMQLSDLLSSLQLSVNCVQSTTFSQLPGVAGKQAVSRIHAAQELWDAGFKGAGVKMGVFDTGIRLDHPHVKNIK